MLINKEPLCFHKMMKLIDYNDFDVSTIPIYVMESYTTMITCLL
jgi:hypothetical protein